MTPEEEQIKRLADEQGVSVATLGALVAGLRVQAGADQFYVFWMTGGGAGAGGASRQRTLLAFPTPDSALVFAQRNRLATPSQLRLRRLSILQLVQATLREPAIAALLFATDPDDAPTMIGQLPRGVRVARADLLQQLHPQTAM